MNPPWLSHALTHDGLAEVPGVKHNPTILRWALDLGPKVLGIPVTDDETPWCGLFVAHCFRAALPAEPLPKIAVRAASWGVFGVASKPAAGAVLVFKRNGGGHVGFYLGEDAATYHVFGGNQTNRVCRTRIEKSRCYAVRWPSSYPLPTGGAVTLQSGGTVSKNEA